MLVTPSLQSPMASNLDSAQRQLPHCAVTRSMLIELVLVGSVSVIEVSQINYLKFHIWFSILNFFWTQKIENRSEKRKESIASCSVLDPRSGVPCGPAFGCEIQCGFISKCEDIVSSTDGRLTRYEDISIYPQLILVFISPHHFSKSFHADTNGSLIFTNENMCDLYHGNDRSTVTAFKKQINLVTTTAH